MIQKYKEVIVLGSGESINQLSHEEISYIKNCEIIIAVNKYAAFYELKGIIPTHIYFVDSFENSLNILGYIIKKFRKNNINNITYILSSEINVLVVTNRIQIFYKFIKHRFQLFKIFIHSRTLFTFKKLLFQKYNYLLISPKNTINFIEHTNWLNMGQWAKSLSEPLFHYRGSLSTVLNYISIKYPGYKVALVGNDFNSSNYFYQKELDNFNLKWKDWTYKIIKKENKHFSAIPFQGKTIFEAFPLITENMKATNNELYCINPNSLLVTKNCVPFKRLNVK
ncbi:hypothetical protein ACT3CD_08305 [Geofilum sp. OHC36d9]|uniref:hypothetical protein n=1 Tax=Geofilum sp. OHC36d9 TaxID=3458413 RepID=UPI004033AF51